MSQLFGIPLGWIMWLLYKVIPNYGIVLILFTILVKAALFPLSIKQQKSTAKMAVFQPKIDEINTKTHGVLDTKHYGDEIHRSWIFRSVGYGHDYQVWKDMMSALRMVGYDDAISIEHEDSLMTPNEGLQKAIAFLKEVLMYEDKGAMWWA